MDDAVSAAVCTGDWVSLYNEESHGYVFSCLSSCFNTELAVGIDQSREQPDLPNVNGAVFAICVPNRYKFAKALAKVESELKSRPENRSVQEEWTQAGELAEAERRDNDAEQKRQSGKHLVYGQIIQLEHRYTRKYIHVCTTKTSWTESSNMLVELTAENGKTALFRVMPRYRVKGEGDIVRNGDQVILESVKSAGQYLRCSRGKFQKSLTYNTFELNLSVKASGFTISRFRTKCHEKEERHQLANQLYAMSSEVIAGGAYLRLFHRELEAYLTPFGGLTAAEEFVPSVALRVRPIDHSRPKTVYPSTSAETYWQIQKERSCMDGSPIMWDEQCRLRHVTAGLFLTVTTELRVSLTADGGDPNTVFRLHPVTKDTQAVVFNAFVRLEHVVTGRWLHGDAKSTIGGNFTRTKKEMVGFAGLGCSTAVHREVVVASEMLYNDAFSLQPIPDDLVLSADFVAGLKPCLQQLADRLGTNAVAEGQSSRVISALHELSTFMILDGLPCKNRQKLLRNFRVSDAVVHILKLSGAKRAASQMKQLVIVCYEVLYAYLRGDSRKNELHLARHLDFFIPQLSVKDAVGLNATLMVMELLRDNRVVIDCLSQKQVASFCKLLKRNRNHHYLQLLQVLCVCDGEALRDNQNYIAEQVLLTKAKESKGPTGIFTTELGQIVGLQPNIVYISSNQGSNWTPLHEFAVKKQETSSYLFLEHQLHLFASLCHGRNQKTMDMLTQQLKAITWEEAYLCLADENMPDQLRAIYCRLLKDLFIDVGSNYSVLDRVNLVFVYADIPMESMAITEKSESITSDCVPLPFLAQLKLWISGFFNANRCMILSQPSRNVLIKEAITLVHCLVEFGYYGNKNDIEELLEAMLLLLDGQNDLPYPVNSSSARSVTILQKYQCSGNRAEADAMVVRYRLAGRFEICHNAEILVDAKCQALRVLDLFFNMRFNLRLEMLLMEFRKVLEGGDVEQKNLLSNEWSVDSQARSEAKFSSNAKWLKKLESMFQETSYFRSNFLTILLDLCNYNNNTLVSLSISLLNRYFSAYENLFNRAVQAQILMTENSCRALRLVHDHIPHIKLLSRAALLSDTEADDMKAILDEFSSICKNGDQLGDDANHINQQILYNHGILDDMFDMLSRQATGSACGTPARDQLFESVFNLLRALSKDNPVAQERLFGRLNFLLNVSAGLDQLAFLLAEIFNGSKCLCTRVQATHVEAIVQALAASQNPALLRVLSALVVVGRLPLRRNQTLVVKMLLQHRRSIDCLTGSSVASRFQLITDTDETDETRVDCRRYLCNIVQLLAFCAGGENKTVESICQCMLGLDELLDIIRFADICGGVRKAFVQFLHATYFLSAAESMATDCQTTGRKLWEYFSILVHEVKAASIYCVAQPTTARALLSCRPQRIHLSNGDDEHEMRELLHYLFDAALPFTASFVSKVDSSMTMDSETDVEIVSTIRNNLRAAIAQLSDALVSLGDDSLERARQTKACLHHLLSETGTNSHLVLDASDTANAVALFVDSSKMKQKRYYASETLLNLQLNSFARNLLTVYEGPNTVQQQLPVSADCYSGPYIEDESLPLGGEFQNLVGCFRDSSVLDADQTTEVLAGRLLKQLTDSMNFSHKTERLKREQVLLDVKCLRVLRAIIHNEIVLMPADRSANKKLFDEHRSRVEAAQRSLIQLGVCHKVLPHLSRNDDTITKEVILLLIAVLHNGNKEAQHSFIDYFLGTREETFFLCMKNCMQRSAGGIKERKMLLAQHKNILRENEEYVKMVVRSNSRLSGSRRGSTASAAGRITPRQGTVATATHVESAIPRTFLWQTWKLIANSVFFNSQKRSRAIVPDIDIEISDSALHNVAENGDVVDEVVRELLDFHDDGHLKLILRLLALLCDGQNRVNQDYIREQRDNIKSFNLVAQTVSMVEILYSSVSMHTIALVVQLVDTLVEFVQGNTTNQVVILDQKIVDCLNFILRQSGWPDCSDIEIWQLRLSVGILLASMTEEDSTIGHAKTVMECLSISHVLQLMSKAFDAIPSAEEPELRRLVESAGLTFCHLLYRANDLGVLSLGQMLSPEAMSAWNHFSQQTASVEIVKSQTVQRSYFAVTDSNILTSAVKEKLKWEIDRSSPSVKLQELIRWGKDIRRDMHFQKRVHAILPLHLLASHWSALNTILLLLTFVINTAVLTLWTTHTSSVDMDNGTVGQWDSVYSQKINLVVYQISFMHNLFSLLVFGSYLLSSKPSLPTISIGRKRLTPVRETSRLSTKLIGFKTGYYASVVLMSILGTLISPALFSFHLLHIAANNQLLLRIIIAVSQNGRSLLWVALMGLIIFYIYALIGFAFFRGVYRENELFCATVWQCFLTMIREGLVYGLTERFDVSPANPDYSFRFYAIKSIFDVSFFIIITTIGLNIIFGIIVDTFSELRDNKWQIENDMKGTCFICSRANFEFERFGKGFDHHIREEHNMWNYLLFFVHLDETPVNQLTALELYVYQLLRQERTDFFPLGRAMGLQKSEDLETDTRMELLMRQVNMLVERVEHEEQQKARMAERRRQELWQAEHCVGRGGHLQRRQTIAFAGPLA